MLCGLWFGSIEAFRRTVPFCTAFLSADMSIEHVLTRCAAVLAAVASAPVAVTYDEFVADLQGPQTQLYVLRFTWALRRNRRSRRPWQTVLDALQQPRPPPFCRALLQHAYGMYNVVRSRASPCLPRPPGRAAYRGYVPRALARVLRRHGVVAFREEDRRSMRDRAAEAVADLWELMPGSRVVLWYDNFYRARYLANPAKGCASLNSSVIAVLALPSLPPTAPDVVSFADALDMLDDVSRMASSTCATLQELVRLVRSTRHLPGDVRVPLDVQRPSVTSLVWRPLQVSECCVSSQTGLLRYMRFSARLASRTETGVAPVLVDENIHYRLQKLAWSEPFARWDVVRFLAVVPPLFGVWHAYKYCVVQVARKLHSSLWYAIRGAMDDGTNVPTSPPLRAYELAFAGLLQLPLSLRDRVSEMRAQWAEQFRRDERDLHVVGTHVGRTPESVPFRMNVRAT